MKTNIKFFHKKSNIKYFYYLVMILSQCMVGINIVGAKFLLQHLPWMFIIFVRFLLGTLLLTCAHLLSLTAKPKRRRQTLKQLTWRDWCFLTLQAWCAGVFFNFLLLIGLNYTTASIAGVITSALPAIIVIMSMIFLREKVTFYGLLSVGFAVLGLLIINAHSLQLDDSHRWWGDLFILLSLLPEAGYYLISKIHKHRLPVFLVSAIMSALNLPVLLVVLIINYSVIPGKIALFDLGILVIIGISSSLFYVFWYLGSKYISGATAGMFTATMPIATLIIAGIFLDEGLSLLQFAGMVLVICSVLFYALQPKATALT